jgi:hypothetical protein
MFLFAEAPEKLLLKNAQKPLDKRESLLYNSHKYITPKGETQLWT